MTPDVMRTWLLNEAQKEGEQFQEEERHGSNLRWAHYHRLDMIARTLWMTGLADRDITNALLHRYLGRDQPDLNEEQSP